jgi:ATP-binding cassette subfamily B protein
MENNTLLFRLFKFLVRRTDSGGNPVDARQQFLSLRNIPRLLRLIWQTSPRLTIANIALRIAASAMPLSMLYVGKLIIDQVIALASANTEAQLEHLWLLAGVELGLAVLSDILSRSIVLVDNLLGDLFSNRSSADLMEHAARLDLYQFEDATFYDKLEKARQQTIGRSFLMSQLLAQFQDAISIVVLSGALIAFNPWLLLVLLLAVIPSFIGETHFNAMRYSLVSGWTPQRRELDYLRYIGASDTSAKEVKIFNLSDFLIGRFRELSDRYYQANKALSIRSAGWSTALFALGTLSYYGAYGYILLNAARGNISIGDLTFLAGSFQRMRSALQALMNRFSDISARAMYLQDYFDFFEIKPSITDIPQAVAVPQPIKQGFVFENVGFRYPGSSHWAIRHLDFHLQAGEKLALVGENGAGKTTLVKLLARLYEPSEGRILLDGRDLRDYQLTDLRANIGIIFQDYVKFAFTAGDNISVGNIEDRFNEGRIEDSARKSLADALIARFPQGYQQMLGRRFAEGLELSGGEWQKIAIARAYMRNAQLLILDEPTAALDARAEHEVFVRFAELISGKSAVLISHRFSTVRMADRILYLEQGMLREAGSHEELMMLDGKYAELFRLQAQGYQ